MHQTHRQKKHARATQETNEFRKMFFLCVLALYRMLQGGKLQKAVLPLESMPRAA
jgi:hypothetical protein